MKKCPVCGTGKARRVCARHGGAEICSQCCAAIRGADCGDCVHYGAAQHHQAERTTRAARGARPDGEFLIEISPETEDAVNAALAIAQQGKITEAWKILTRLLRERPHDQTVCFGIGVLHTMQRDFVQAVEWYDKAIAIFPYMIEAHYNKAAACLKLMDVPCSLRAYRKVVEFGERNDPTVKDAREQLDSIETGLRKHYQIGVDKFLAAADAFNLAFDFMEKGAWQEAADHFRKSAALNERSTPTHGNLGLCYAQLGRKAEALAELDRALELDPAYEHARTNRKVVVKMTEGQPMESVIFKNVDSIQEGLAKMGKT